MTKVGTFENKNVDLVKLNGNVKKMLQDEKFGITRDETTEYSYHLKANKTGVTRIIVGATRNVDLVIAGEPNAFAVTLSVGSWGKNLAISSTTGYVVATVAAAIVAAPAVATGAILAAGSYVSAKAFEASFFNKIKDEINKLAKPKKK